MGGRVAAAAASGERGRKCVNPGLHIEDFSLIALVESSTLSPFLSYLLAESSNPCFQCLFPRALAGRRKFTVATAKGRSA
eukprot:m.57979 g.57979  ORF g.57979 m.57979 type:complete len:80 (+) comp49103_c1_seq1:382-621(+)